MANNQTDHQAHLSPTEVRLTELTNGTKVQIPKTSPVTIGGVIYSQAQIVAKILGWLSLYQAARDERQKLAQALQARRAAMSELHQFANEYHAALVARFGERNPVLRAFGFTPKVAKIQTAAEKVQASLKRANTRKGNHYLGPKQRAAIKSEGTAQVETTAAVTPPAEVSPAAAPKGTGTGS